MVSRAFRSVFIVLLAVAAIPVIFLAWMTIVDYRPPEREVLAQSDGTAVSDSILRIVTWNIGYAGLGREMDFFYDRGRMTRAYPSLYEKYKEDIQKELNSYRDFDMLLLQEIDRHSARSYFDDQMEWLGHTLPEHSGYFAWNYRVNFIPAPILKPLGRVRAGMATFSKPPARYAARISYSGNYSWPLRLFMLDRCYILTRFSLEGNKVGELVVINTHNSAFDDGSLRQQQIDQLTKVMVEEYEKGNYVIAGGDWNMNPPGYQPWLVETGDAAEMLQGPPMSAESLPPGWKWAYDASVPSNRMLRAPYMKALIPATLIDFFIVSPNLEVLEVKTADLGFESSDHNPVTLVVKIVP